MLMDGYIFVLRVQFNFLLGSVEAVIHSMKTLFSNDHTKGMLLVDAGNAFNSLSRNVTSSIYVLHSLHYLLKPTVILLPCMLMGMFFKELLREIH